MSAPSAYWQKHNCQPQQKTDRGGSARSHLTRSGRRNYVVFYGVSPSNPLAFEAAARVRRVMANLLPESRVQSKPNPPRLVNRVRAVMRLKHYSLRAERTYWEWIEHVKAALTCRELLQRSACITSR